LPSLASRRPAAGELPSVEEKLWTMVKDWAAAGRAEMRAETRRTEARMRRGAEIRERTAGLEGKCGEGECGEGECAGLQAGKELPQALDAASISPIPP
jgi:uncharacterized low-complexity protein